MTNETNSQEMNGRTAFSGIYERMKKAYFNIFNRLGIGRQTYFTYASGGTFSKYSHEFQTLTSAGEDKIHICEKCRVAVNKEIINLLEIGLLRIKK